MNYQKQQKGKAKEEEKKNEVKDLKKKREEELKCIEDKKAEESKAAENVDKENEAFWGKLDESEDLNDNLAELTCYIHRNINATGVYIGQLEPPMKEIADDAGDEDHLDPEAPLVLKYKYANKDHEDCMVGAVLTGDSGITHTLFGEGEEAVEEEAPEEDEEGAATTKVDKTDILNVAKFKYVSEVVEEPKIKFWKVPRLGSYMAIPIVYKSCLFEGSLDKAITDWIEVKAEVARLEEEREEAAGGEEKKDDDNEGSNEPPEKEPIHIEPPPFETQENKFVLCIDTLGQDR